MEREFKGNDIARKYILLLSRDGSQNKVNLKKTLSVKTKERKVRIIEKAESKNTGKISKKQLSEIKTKQRKGLPK